MPYLQRGQRGKEWTFDTADVFNWEKDQAIKDTVGDFTAVSEDEMKMRKLAAETGKAEIELAKARGEVAPLHDMEIAWRDSVLEFKARIRLLPSRVAGQMVGLDNETEIKAVLLDEVDQSLTVLSEYSPNEHD